MRVRRIACLWVLAVLVTAAPARAQVQLPAEPTPAPLPAPDASPTAQPSPGPTAGPTPAATATATPSPEPTPKATRTPRPALPEGRTLRSALRRAYLAERIDRRTYEAGVAAWERARGALRRLPGRRRVELQRVLGMLEQLAAEGRLHSSRVGLAVETLRFNVLAWRTQPLPVPRERRISGGLVFQYVPGRGFHHHPLGSFGRANALARPCLTVARARRSAGMAGARRASLLGRAGAGPRWTLPEVRRAERRRARKEARERRAREPRCRRAALRRTADALAGLAADRGGFLAWEYLFPFGGVQWPWMSAMTQGTAVQALARAGEALGEASYLKLADRALGAFEAAPPAGVKVAGGYAMYSQTPTLEVLNGFLQSLIGLHDHAEITGSQRSAALFERAERFAPEAVRAADTGAWSLYSRGGRESTLHYHRLVTDFLGGLCERTGRKAYCSAERRFAFYELEPPRIRPAWPARARAKERSQVTFSLSKGSDVVLRARNFSRRLTLPRGSHTIVWTPARKGRDRLRLSATGPEGRTATVRHRVRVAPSRAELEARARRREARREAARRRAERRERAEKRREREEKRRDRGERAEERREREERRDGARARDRSPRRDGSQGSDGGERRPPGPESGSGEPAPQDAATSSADATV